MKVDLQKAVEAIEMIMDSSTDWFDVQTQEVIGVSEYMETDEQEEIYDMIDADPDRYIRLPSQYDIHGYSIMEEFIDSLPNGKLKNDLYRAIRGKGAFRRFKDAVAYHGIREDWFAFEHQAYIEITKRWCRDHDLDYDDVPIA